MLQSIAYKEFRKEITEESITTARASELLDHFQSILNNDQFTEALIEEMTRKGKPLTKT